VSTAPLWLAPIFRGETLLQIVGATYFERDWPDPEN
jgi:hypothetical protein